MFSKKNMHKIYHNIHNKQDLLYKRWAFIV